MTLTLCWIYCTQQNIDGFPLHCVPAGGHHQDTKVRVNIRVKDVNDNPPEFANNNEVFMCENVAPGKVRLPAYLKCLYMHVFADIRIKKDI